MSRRRCIRTAVSALAALAALAVGSSTASAGVLVASAPSCANQPLSQPFAPWLDYASYTPLPGGDFESGAAGWSLSGGSGVVAGNEPYKVGGADHAYSLALPAGASATSAPICVGLEHPTIRFFAKRRSTLASLSTLRVDVLFELSNGSVESLTVGTASNGGSWQPTLPMVVAANLLPLLPGNHTPVAFRFTAQDGDWSIDDVYVDPYARK